ncbi:MAG: hypothetical protein IK003_09520 [Prevotella sp.]|nr:hypothetical protein [Prevotella sp.]
MRLLFIFIFSFANISIFGQINEMDFVVKNAYYISIDIDMKQNYPIMFDVILDKNDSLIVNTNSEQDFINNILQNTTYVPRCWSSGVFIKLYGDDGVDTINRFRNLFFDEMEKNGRKETLKLASGGMVNISYIGLKGVFVQLNKEISFSHGLDQKDNPKVINPCIPLAITEYILTNNLPKNK